MKHNISDLLDDLPVEDVALPNTSLLSGRRIRENTLMRLGVKKSRPVWRLHRAAVIAAVLLSLIVTACAADTMLNDGNFFGGFFGSNLSQKQVEVLNHIGRNYDEDDSFFDEKLSSNGATITPVSAVCDGRICYVYLRVKAPEGVVLRDLPENRRYSFSGDYEQMKVEFAHESYPVDAQVIPLPDKDCTDNVKEFVLEIYGYWPMGFNGNNVKLKIPGLWIKGSNDSRVWSKLFSSDIRFDLTTKSANCRLDLENTGLSIYNEEYDFTVNLDRVFITPLRMEIHYTATLPEDEDILPDGGYAQIVMKDGTKLTYGDLSNVSDGADVGYQRISKVEEFYGLDLTDIAREGNLDHTDRFQFEEPLVLEDIDYIVWCGGQVIDVN